MKPTIIINKESCEGCIACLKACPMNAIIIENGRVKIDSNRCINCLHCLNKCKDHALSTKGSSLEAIKDYDFTICLVPSALMHHFESNVEIEKIFYAIHELGFDEVFDLSPFETMAEEAFFKEEGPCISSFCPVCKRVIKYDYPTLLEQLSKVDYPSEIASRYYRKKYSHKTNVGIFLLCECSSKLLLAKHPYNNYQYETDHTLAIRDIFPLIKLNPSDKRKEVRLSYKGFSYSNVESAYKCSSHLIADGLEKVIDILEKREINRINNFEHYSFYSCFNGCIGGDLLWGNPYSCKYNYQKIKCEDIKIEDVEVFNPRVEKDEVIKETFKERIAFYEAVGEVLKKLPGYDCAACGYPSCRFLAEAIVKNKAEVSNCKILRGEDET